jgi:hypothetical protein
MNCKTFWIVVFALITSISGFSQEVDLRKRLVLERFESDAAIQWVRYFRGYLDHRYVVDILLASDGEQIHGAMRVELDSLVYYLDGVQQDSTFLLEETDENGSDVAFVTGIFNGLEFNGYWKNKRGDIQLPFRFTDPKQFKRLPVASPRLISFDTRDEPWKGHWSLYTDGVGQLAGSFTDGQGQWYQVRSGGLFGHLWKMILIGKEAPFVRTVFLHLDEKRLLTDPEAEGFRLKKWREYAVFTFKNTVSYSAFSSVMQVNQEFNRLRLYTEGQLPVPDLQKHAGEEEFRAYALYYDFFIPVLLDEDWIVGQWVRSSYSQDMGHVYEDFLFHFRLSNWEVFKPELWKSETQIQPEELLQHAPPLETVFGDDPIWQLLSEFPEAGVFDRIVYTPRGAFLVNHYNHYSGMMMIPLSHAGLDEWLSDKLRNTK